MDKHLLIRNIRIDRGGGSTGTSGGRGTHGL
jgi:hypothetical protein